MKQRKGRLVTSQRTNIIDEHTTGEGNSPYWTFASKHNAIKDGTLDENIHANPDHLTDTDDNKLWGDGVSPELAGRIIEEFTDGKGNFPILSEQENLVLRIYVTTGSIDEVKRRMKLSRSSINTYMARIRSKLQRLLKSRDF